MSELRKEIVESQKQRSDLLRTKLIIVATLGAAGLGLTQTPASGAFLVLSLIPLVCFYVDLLCRHLQLRIVVIGTFLRMVASGEQAAYERFVGESARMGPSRTMNVFALEDWALEGSTVVLCIAVVLAGVALPAIVQNPTSQIPVMGTEVSLVQLGQILFSIAGVAGIALTLLVRKRCTLRRDALQTLSECAELRNEVRGMCGATPLVTPSSGGSEPSSLPS